MLDGRFLPRPVWEDKLRAIGAVRVQDGTTFSSAEAWKRGKGLPFMVPVEDNGDCEFWALQRIIEAQTGKPILSPLDIEKPRRRAPRAR
jgi:hypothetical protein